MDQGLFGRFFQLGYVTRDINRAIEVLVHEQSATVIDLFEDFRDEAGAPIAIRKLSHLTLGDAEIELIEPRPDWDSPYLDALPAETAAMGFHHIGYMQPDIAHWELAMTTARERGLATVMQGGTAYARFAYLDTRRQNGHYSEIVWRAPR